MATSGSVNYNVTRNDIITEALELAGVLGVGDTATAAQITSCSRTLNMLIKAWQAKGVFIWHTSDFYVFPQKSTASFDLGATGDHATLSYNKTELAADGNSGDGTITVDDDGDISDGDYIGIELDNGTLQWTTVNGTPVSNVVTLTATLTDDVTEDANVYTYTTKISRPLWISENGRLSLDGDSEAPFVIRARNDYNNISIKTATGNPNTGFYDPQLTDGKLYVWPTSNNVKNFLILTGKFTIEDFDSATDDADFPQEWYLPLSWNLACAVAPKFLKQPLNPIMEQKAAMYLDEAVSFDKDFGNIYIKMG